MTDLVVQATGVDTWLGDQQILFDIDLDVAAGEVVALLGGNGSGKTTLLRTLLGLVPHQRGQIELFGCPLAHFHDWARIGYVPQRGRLNVPNATVYEVVMLGRLSRRPLFRLPRAIDRDAVARALERVGLGGVGARPMAQLSGGQQQRALIARALAGEADLLILDEPLAALDVRTQTSLARLLARLHDEGLTVLTVLHELGAMEPLLQRSVVLQLGRVIHNGPLRAGPPVDHCHDTDHPDASVLLAPQLGIDPKQVV